MATNPSSARRAFADHVVDLLRGMGAVRAKPMFGGHGLYLDGVMFALLADGRCFIKVWALEGALSGRSWRQVAEQDRLSLLMALEDAQSHRR